MGPSLEKVVSQFVVWMKLRHAENERRATFTRALISDRAILLKTEAAELRAVMEAFDKLVMGQLDSLDAAQLGACIQIQEQRAGLSDAPGSDSPDQAA